MFQNASAFNQNISKWNLPDANDLTNMFKDAVAFDHDISNWSLKPDAKTTNMFQGATAFNNKFKCTAVNGFAGGVHGPPSTCKLK